MGSFKNENYFLQYPYFVRKNPNFWRFSFTATILAPVLILQNVPASCMSSSEFPSFRGIWAENLNTKKTLSINGLNRPNSTDTPQTYMYQLAHDITNKSTMLKVKPQISMNINSVRPDSIQYNTQWGASSCTVQQRIWQTGQMP